MDHDLNVGVKLHRAHTEQLLHVDDADTPDLNVVADDLRGRAVQGVGNAANLHRVVGHQPVAALEQLDGGFAFADAGIADHQHPLAIDVHQDAVAGDLGGQGPVQIVDDVAGQLHGGLFCPQQGAPVLAGNLHQLRKNLHIPGMIRAGISQRSRSSNTFRRCSRGMAFRKVNSALPRICRRFGSK